MPEEVLQERVSSITPYEAFAERSEDAQEIITRKPDFYERWALLVFLVIMLLFIAGTWFIKYPVVIEAGGTLTGHNAPKQIIPKQTGRLTGLFVKNNQSVRQGEILGWIESSADTKEVIDLAERLDSSLKMLGDDRSESLAALFNRRFTHLGELQIGYQNFISSFQQYNDYLVNGFYAKRKMLLQQDIASLQNIEATVTLQKDFTVKENELAKKTFEMNESLYKEKVISAEEYRQAQNALLIKQKDDSQMEVKIITQQSQIREKQKEIDQLNHDVLQQRQTFEQALQTLRSSTEQWLQRYTLIAPSDGAVVLALPIQQNQYVEQGKLLGYVNPHDSEFYVLIKLSQNNFGKVDTGMKVQLRFDAYPYQEVGFVPGTLDYISNVSVDSGFLGTIRLDKGLISSQNKSIQYKNGLKTRAIIITKDISLLQRIYYSIVKAASIDK